MSVGEFSVETVHELIKLRPDLFAQETEQQRLIADFKSGRFYGLAIHDSSGQLSAYLIYYFSYSTWENRVVYISEIWLGNAPDSAKLRLFVQRLVSIARSKRCNRINYNLSLDQDTDQLIGQVVQEESIGLVNLSEAEDWRLFEMSHQDMLTFARDQSIEARVDASKYKVFKVSSNMSDYSSDICELIRELAVFEKMEDQMKMTPGDLERDYDFAKSDLSASGQELRFYEACVVSELTPDGQAAKTVGYALYYLNYDLKRGTGCYLEDLYIVESKRRAGLGKLLWQTMIRDCLDNFKARYMNWCVLAWNQGAIDLYYSLNSKNLYETAKANVFRLVKEKIYNSDSF